MKSAHVLRLGIAYTTLFMASHCLAQVTGTPPFGSFGGGPDVINLANLNSHFSIPVIQKAGRGMPFYYILSYDTLIWTPVSVNGVKTWQPINNWGWTAQTQVTTGYVSYSKTTQHIGYPDYCIDTTYSNYVFYDYFGAGHPLPLLVETGCDFDNPGPWTATASDGSGYTLTTQSGSDATIIDRAGRVFNPPINNKAGSGTKTDTNGNQVTVNSSGQFYDTLSNSAAVLTVSGTAPTSTTFKYTAPNLGTATYTMNYTTYTVKTNFGCTGNSAVAEYAAASISLVSSIQLPDGTSYSFTYEPTPGYSSDVTGRLKSITLPTGGTISYTYTGGSNGIICSDGSTAGLQRSTPDSGSTPWQYARTIGSGAASITTITDPTAAANQTVINFQQIYETERQVYQGSTSGTLLATVNTCYNSSASPCTGTAITLPIARRTATTQFPGGSASKVDTYYNGYGLVTENDEYDYGASTPSRKTLITYATLGNNINSSYYTVTVQDGNGTNYGKTVYSYDQTGVTATSGTPQHVSVTGARGNLTSIMYYTGASSTIQKTFTYYDTGTLNTSVDVNNATTTYNYSSGSCGNAFPTSVTLPLNLTRPMGWNCTGGVQTSSTDENGQTVSTAYADPYFWRPYSATDQLSNVTTMTYTPTSVESVLPFNGTSSAVDVLTTLDSSGRPHVSQARQAPGSANFDSTETDYDILGRISRTTIPYTATAGQTSSAPAGTTTYDALNRPLTVADGGGGTVTYSYTQNDVLSSVGPAPSGENTKRRQSEYDALGRLTSVCELTSLSGSGTCGQVSSATGYWTKYSYNPLNVIAGVTQNAQQSGATQPRTFAYDYLGRLTSEINPESGTTSYTYDTDSTCGTYDGDLVKRVDAYGNTTCYAYDAFHRTTSVTYKSGPYSATSVTPTKCYVYDSATVNGQTMSYAATRMAEAYTTSATSCNGTSKITDYGFSYSKRGELTDVYESTPHSNGYYHSSASYWANGALNTLNPLNSATLPTFTYGADGEGRPNFVSASAGTSPIPTPSNVSYNTAGEVTAITFGTGDSDSFGFDGNTFRMNSYTFTVGASPNTKTVSGVPTWNANGTLSSVAITDQFNSSNTQTCGYSYDDLGRISVVNCGALASSWNANGGSGIYHLCGRADGDGWSASVGLDSPPCWLEYGPYTTQLTSAGYYTAQWVLMVDNNTADNSQVAWIDVTAWNGTTLTTLGGINLTREQFNSPNTYQTFSIPFYLDAAHAGQQIQFRVLWSGASYVKEKSLDYDTSALWLQNFGYDAFGNITKNGNDLFNVMYDTSKNQVGTGQSFTYDANGNSTHDNVRAYTWDAEGHAITIGTIGLSYDALGRMVEQYNGLSYTQILYGPTGKLALMNGQNVTKAFIPLPAGATAVYTSGPTLSYFRHPDWLGSSRFASTASRTMYYSGAYAPFGETYSEAGTTDRSFTGQNQDTVPDSTAGLYDFTFREYAQYGRWISPDPAGLAAVDPTNPQSWNRYAYVMNNPLAFVDPMGLDPCTDNRIGLCELWDDLGPGQWMVCDFIDHFDEGYVYQTIGNCHPVDIPRTSGQGGGKKAPANNCTPGTKGCFNVPQAEQCSVAVACDTSVAPHCGITVGQSGSYTQYDGMPSTRSMLQILNPFSSQPKLDVQVLPNSPPPGGPGGGNIVFQAPASCGVAGCIQTVTSYFKSAQWTYSAPFLNSNTYAASTTRACGLSVNYPWNAIGTH